METVTDVETIGTDSLALEEIARRHLLNQSIYDIHLGKTELWAATRLGVYRYDLETDKGHFFDDASGPRDNFITRISGIDDEIWFGGDGTVEGFDAGRDEWFDTPERKIDFPSEIQALAVDENAVWAGTARA